MSETGIAKLFMHGRSQAVRLPKAFRLPGDRVRVRRTQEGVLLQPMFVNVDAWFDELDRMREGQTFLPEGRPEGPSLADGEDTWD